jgi:hypothetical protein
MRRTEKALLLRRGAYQLKSAALGRLARLVSGREDAQVVIDLCTIAIDAAITMLYPQPLELVMPPTSSCPHSRVRADNYGEVCLDCGAQISVVT